MRPLALRITNFRSFKGVQAFVFPERPGLYFMQGVNEAEPRLEANGSGKSSIWDALAWVSFEKTPSGLKAGDVCNWDAEKGACVEFDYCFDGEPVVWTVRRTWKPNTWTLSHVAECITDEEVIDLTKAEGNAYLADLRLGFTAFLNSVLTAQRQPMFLDLDHNAQAALFSDVMGLDRWLDYSAKASKKASAQDAISRGLERELSGLEGQLSALGRQDFRQSQDRWEEQRRQRVQGLEDEHARLTAKGKGLKDAAERAQALEAEARDGVRKAQPDQEAQAAFRAAQASLRSVEGDLREQQTNRNALHSHMDRLEADAKCPTCGQSLDREHRRQELRRAEDALRGVNALIAAIERREANAKEALKKAGEQVERDGDALTKARDWLDEAQREAGNARRAFDLNERELDRLEEEAERVVAEANPYKDMEKKRREDEEGLRARYVKLRAALDASNARQALLSFWVRGFKEVRLSQIAEALTELEIEVNSCVAALGLVDWELRFQVDRETKGGNIQRGFNTFVRSPHNERAVPWAAWSGGEGQRLRLAATMGLANLIRSRTGATLNLEVWDEPTQGLSPQGAQDLLEALAARAQADGRQIWIIDHTSHDFGGFAGGAIVTKAKAGSVIAQH
jgi:DNA repair exonuclease SbcCD ATPase subunit